MKRGLRELSTPYRDQHQSQRSALLGREMHVTHGFFRDYLSRAIGSALGTTNPLDNDSLHLRGTSRATASPVSWTNDTLVGNEGQLGGFLEREQPRLLVSVNGGMAHILKDMA